jgi:predicted metalloprotease with PDZ domain
MKLKPVLCLAVEMALLFIAVRPASATIRYSVSLDHPEKHLFHVTMTIPARGGETLVALPAWNALYQVRDFAIRVRDVTAVCTSSAGVPMQVWKLDKDTWRVGPSAPCGPEGKNSFEIRYAIEWDDVGPFDSQLNDHHAFLNLAEVLMYVPDRRAEDTQVTFENVPEGWNITSELSAGPQPLSFIAPSYDALVDAPVEAGKFEEFGFDSGGAHFRVIVDASSWNRGHLENALRRITAYELQLMGGPPFREFAFIFHIGSESAVGAGGMEHANSTAIADSSLEGAVSIAAHEFFHVWNVKRIRPQALEPVDYSREQYTRELWFAEGVTDTYRSYTLERTGLSSKRQFYDDLASQIEKLESRPAHAWQSVEESSLDAWFEKYEAYNTPDRSVSYYNKGQIVGEMLDLTIRAATDNRKSLDNVMRLMNEKYAKQGKFYNETGDIRAAVEEVAGKSFEDFFRRYVSGVDEIPYNDILGIAGLQLKTDNGYSISEISHPTDRQRRIREGFLHGSTD